MEVVPERMKGNKITSVFILPEQQGKRSLHSRRQETRVEMGYGQRELVLAMVPLSHPPEYVWEKVVYINFEFREMVETRI